MVNSMLPKVLSWNAWNVLMRTQRRRKRTDPVHRRYRNNQIATSAILLDIMHESYGFNADLIEVIKVTGYPLNNVVGAKSLWP